MCVCVCVCLFFVVVFFLFCFVLFSFTLIYEPPHDWHVRPAKTSDQPGHPPSLTRVFAVRSVDS